MLWAPVFLYLHPKAQLFQDAYVVVYRSDGRYLSYSMPFSEFMQNQFTRKMRAKHDDTRSPPFSYDITEDLVFLVVLCGEGNWHHVQWSHYLISPQWSRKVDFHWRVHKSNRYLYVMCIMITCTDKLYLSLVLIYVCLWVLGGGGGYAI